MRKRTLGVVLVAGLAISGGSAFTASNTLPTSTAGYGANTVSGAVVSDIAYVANSTDSSLLDSVKFTSAEDLSGKTGSMTLRLTDGTIVGSAYSCSLSQTLLDSTTGLFVSGTSQSVFTCSTAATDPAINSFQSVGLSVVDA